MAKVVKVLFHCTRNCYCGGRPLSAGNVFEVTSEQAADLLRAHRGRLYKAEPIETAIPKIPIEQAAIQNKRPSLSKRLASSVRKVPLKPAKPGKKR